MTRRLQPCSVPHCLERSVPGLVSGSGLCPYHWAVAHWGQAYADSLYKKPAPPSK